MNRKENPIAAYVVASHIAFVVITPLLLFIWGGTWLADYFNLPEWTKIVFILTGIIVMAASLISYLARLISMYDNSEKIEKPAFKNESDYYYENNYKKPAAKSQKKRTGGTDSD